MGREIGGRFGREGIWVYLWVILVDVFQKTPKFPKTFKQKLAKKKKKERKSQTYNTTTYSVIPFIRHSEKGKITETKSDQWLPGVGE